MVSIHFHVKTNTLSARSNNEPRNYINGTQIENLASKRRLINAREIIGM